MQDIEILRDGQPVTKRKRKRPAKQDGGERSLQQQAAGINKPIPVAAAKRIAKQYGYDQVVILARTVKPHRAQTSTYGTNIKHCQAAGRMGQAFLDLESGAATILGTRSSDV